MGSNFDELVSFVENKKKKIETIDKDRNEYRALYDKWTKSVMNSYNAYLKYMEDSYNDLRQARDDYFSTLTETVTLKLGDILSEYYSLTSLNRENAVVFARPNVFIDEGDDLYEECKQAERYHKLEVVIKSKEGDKLKYLTAFAVPLEFDAIQGDGKTLYEHCYLEDREYDTKEVCLDGDVDEFLCKFTIGELTSNATRSKKMKSAIISAYNAQELVKE